MHNSGVIARGVFTSVSDLKRKLLRYIRQYNKSPRTVKWKYADPSHRAISVHNQLVQATSMVANRYSQRPIIKDVQEIIAEGVEAHFLKLDHIAASGLVPVVEGATRRLANAHGIEVHKFKPTFSALVKHCKDHVTENRIGDIGEIVSMLESFELFLSKVLFAKTEDYSLTDGTNRHGMAHGIFSDKEFGSPLNFYKIITAINFLTFMSSLYYGGSGFAPDETMQSRELARYYRTLSQIASEQHP